MSDREQAEELKDAGMWPGKYKSAEEMEAHLEGVTLEESRWRRALKAEASHQLRQLREDIRAAFKSFPGKPERVRIFSGYLSLIVHAHGPVLGLEPYKFQGVAVVSDPDIEAVAFIIE
jgi:hypothetical protein